MPTRVLLTLAVLLAPAAAHADMIGPGEKGVKHSIKVEAAVPAGKALVLANTFQGADPVTPGTVQEFGHHPMIGGDPELVLLDAAEAAKIPPLREGLDRDRIKPIVDRGTRCGAAFKPPRTISDKLAAVELRWSFRVDFAGGCKATQTAYEGIDGAGAVVAPEQAALPSPLDVQTAPPQPTKVAPETKVEAKAEAKPAEKTGMCSVGAPAPGLALLGLLALRRRRR
jgi:hypothetical protein